MCPSLPVLRVVGIFTVIPVCIPGDRYPGTSMHTLVSLAIVKDSHRFDGPVCILHRHIGRAVQKAVMSRRLLAGTTCWKLHGTNVPGSVFDVPGGVGLTTFRDTPPRRRTTLSAPSRARNYSWGISLQLWRTIVISSGNRNHASWSTIVPGLLKNGHCAVGAYDLQRLWYKIVGTLHR